MASNPSLPTGSNPADALRSELLRTQAELQRRIWARDPVSWAQERGHTELWYGQKQIMRALLKHRRVAVQSSNGVGKSRLAAVVACWWIDTHPPGEAFVLSSAATMQQVETRLWREIHRVHEAGGLAGRLNLTSWIMPMGGKGREEVVALGVKPADNDPSALKGLHAPAVLVIFDEAQAMDQALWSAAGTLTTSEASRFLAIGNPDTQLCRFYDVCQPGSGWFHLAYSAYDSPNFFTAFEPGTFKPERPLPKVALDSLVNQRFVQDIIDDWGLDHPFYISQVEGKFPETSDDTLIRLDWIKAAQQSHLESGGVVEVGVDVGGGVNKSVLVVRHGSVATLFRVKSTPDTSVVVADCCDAYEKFEPTQIKIDAIGIGNNVAAMLASGMLVRKGKQFKYPAIGINVGGQPTEAGKSDFGNLRAEGYWQLRELFRTRQIKLPSGTPDAERLAGELAGLRYRTNSGRIWIESKEEMKKRGRQSPDLADALMLAFINPTVPKRKVKLTWG